MDRDNDGNYDCDDDGADDGDRSRGMVTKNGVRESGI
jgi:hypothetical protein